MWEDNERLARLSCEHSSAEKRKHLALAGSRPDTATHASLSRAFPPRAYGIRKTLHKAHGPFQP